MRDESEVEVEGQAIQTFGPRFSFKLGSPPHDELVNKIKIKRIYRTGRCLYSISLLRLPLHLILCYRTSRPLSGNDLPVLESRYLISAITSSTLAHAWTLEFWSTRQFWIVNTGHQNLESQSCLFETAPRRKTKHLFYAITIPLPSYRDTDHDPSATPPSHRPSHRQLAPPARR